MAPTKCKPTPSPLLPVKKKKKEGKREGKGRERREKKGKRRRNVKRGNKRPLPRKKKKKRKIKRAWGREREGISFTIFSTNRLLISGRKALTSPFPPAKWIVKERKGKCERKELKKRKNKIKLSKKKKVGEISCDFSANKVWIGWGAKGRCIPSKREQEREGREKKFELCSYLVWNLKMYKPITVILNIVQ